MVLILMMKLLLWENLIHNIYHIPHWFYHFFIFINMRKRNWPDRKNRRCPSCTKMLTYTRKDSFDRAVGNNSVCKSCAHQDRKLTLETIEKMRKPKTIEHKKKISYGVQKWWDTKRDKWQELSQNR